MIIEDLPWFDDNPARTLADKIDRAVWRYQQKYHCCPDVVYVHPSALLDKKAIERADGIKVLPAKSVLPHHFWLGVEDKSKDKKVSAKK